MAAYVIVDVEVTDPERYEEYKAMVPPTLAAYGGKFLVRGGDIDHIEPGFEFNRIVILEFESVDRARAWHDSPEYAEALALRKATTNSRMMVVEGV
ncbi:MAG: DUF1330 domain-containing protein [Pseudomonadota bacterium]